MDTQSIVKIIDKFREFVDVTTKTFIDITNVCLKLDERISKLENEGRVVEEYPDEDLFEDGELNKQQAGLKLMKMKGNGEIYILRDIKPF